jgi:hypothetical protein
MPSSHRSRPAYCGILLDTLASTHAMSGRLTTGMAIALAGLAVLLAIALSLRVHMVADTEMGTTLLWNDREAFVFIPRQRLAWSGSYLGFAWRALRPALGASFGMKPVLGWETILVITPDGVQERTLPEAFWIAGLADGAIIGSLGGQTCRWNGETAVPVSAEDLVRIPPALQAITRLDGSNGWNGRVNLLTGDEGMVALRLDHSDVKLTVHRPGPEAKELTVQFPNQESRQIWSLDQRTRFVSVREFDAARRHSPRER